MKFKFLQQLENAEMDTVTLCYPFDTIDTNFHESSPNKCNFSGQERILIKFIVRDSDWTKPLRGSVA